MKINKLQKLVEDRAPINRELYQIKLFVQSSDRNHYRDPIPQKVTSIIYSPKLKRILLICDGISKTFSYNEIKDLEYDMMINKIGSICYPGIWAYYPAYHTYETIATRAGFYIDREVRKDDCGFTDNITMFSGASSYNENGVQKFDSHIEPAPEYFRKRPKFGSMDK